MERTTHIRLGLADVFTHEPPHVHAQERHLEHTRRRLCREGLAAARHPRDEYALRDVDTELLRAAHVAEDLCLCPQPVLQILKTADVLDSLLHRHHLKDARFLDHLLFLTEHHRQVTRVKLSIIAHSEGEDVVDLRLTQPA